MVLGSGPGFKAMNRFKTGVSDPKMVQRRHMKLLDWFFLAASFSLTVGTAWAVFAPSSSPPQVEIQDPEGTFVYPLNQDRTIRAHGPLGTTTIDVSSGKVWVEDSPCVNKVCIASGSIQHSGQFVACLPNHVFVRIAGGAPSSEELDAQVR
jgi:hypothetical protein